jgi:ankyrin repeat protein
LQEFEEAVIDSKVNKCRDALSGGSIIDVNLQNSAGQTLLHRLCEIDCKASHSQCELIDILVNNGARMDIRDRSGRIPLHVG